MENTIKLDCPYCSYDHAITRIPGKQHHHCTNCGNDFVVVIDDYGRVLTLKLQGAPGAPPPIHAYPEFAGRLERTLASAGWQRLPADDIPAQIAYIARKEFGWGYKTQRFLGLVNGDACPDASAMQSLLRDFVQVIDRQTHTWDLQYLNFSGLLLAAFSDVTITTLDDESRRLEENHFGKRIYSSVGAYDLIQKMYFGPASADGKVWEPIVTPLLQDAWG